jgi:hypothetical protein
MVDASPLFMNKPTPDAAMQQIAEAVMQPRSTGPSPVATAGEPKDGPVLASNFLRAIVADIGIIFLFGKISVEFFP